MSTERSAATASDTSSPGISSPGTSSPGVASSASTGRPFTMTRTFNAPRDLVFKAFSEAERLARWWGPKGLDVHVNRLDFRPGGDFHYKMSSPDGFEMWGRFIYREIVAPERIVWVNTFSDPDGNLVRAPFGETIPLEILNAITLEERGGKTILTLRAHAINETTAERATYEGMFDSMTEGYGGTWEKLDVYLASADAGA